LETFSLRTGTRSASGFRGPDGFSPRAVARWHTLLRAAAVLNGVLWLSAAVAVTRATAVETNATCQLQLLLSAGYVFACAFRSILPVYDIPRIVLVDSFWSSVLVGRAVATVGELCFAAQWALILHHIALLSDNPFGRAASLALVPLILIAEAFSWYAVLTTRQGGHVVENSIWGAAAAVVVASMLAVGPHQVANLYAPMSAWWVGGAAYVLFMFWLDVPMYWSRWRADQAAGRSYLSIAQGVVDVWQRRTVSYRWEDWKTEVWWMSLYFTLGVWSSISIVYACLELGN
jgi:hypothetical protein